MAKVVEKEHLGRGGEQPQFQVVPQAPQRERGFPFDIFDGNKRRQRRVEARLAQAKSAELKAQKEALKAVGDESWRLVDMEVTHTYGEKTREVGFNSEYDELGNPTKKEPETIDSSKTPFRDTILLIPLDIIGTHEATTKVGMQGVSFRAKGGWDGPAIAIAPVLDNQNENGSDVFRALFEAVTANGGRGVVDASKLKYGDFVVLDGHHRLEKAREEGLAYVVGQMIPFGTHDSVILDTWGGANPPRVKASPQVIYRCARNSKEVVIAKATKFGVKGADGETRRILDALPDVKVPLENLMPLTA